jgi:hypothetical protein
MSGTTDPVVAIVERMMERLQKENPSVNYKRKPKKEKSCKPKRKRSPLH